MDVARGLLLLLVLGSAGCLRHPTITVWQPAQGGQAIHRVVLTSPVGRDELTGPLMAAMEREQPPRDYPLRIMDLASLAPYQQVQLASYDGRPNDLAILDAARRAGLEAAIHGEIVYERMEVAEERRWWRRKAPERLTMMWRVVDVTTGQTTAQQAIAVDRNQAVRSYPDLKELSKIDGPQAVYIAAARDSWKWIAPHLGKDRAPLAQAGWLPGLPQMLRAETMAKQGDWAGAEQQWREVVERHPWHGAAWHNLAIAGVARA
ncbi:MAG: tetratricopeptide repeat protein, partial [Pirellulaceae bacterium]